MYKLFLWFVIILFSCKSDKEVQQTTDIDPRIVSLNAEIKKQPDNASLLLERAKVYREIDSLDYAIFDLKKAIEIDSLNPIIYHELSDVYLDYFNSQEALNTLYKILSYLPENVPSLLKQARLKYILEEYDPSILTLNEVIRLDPQNADAFLLLGYNMKAIGENDRAINSFQTATELNSSLTDAWIELSKMYEDKDSKKALQYIESAILSNPESMEALHGKAYYLQTHNQVEESKNIYKDIIIRNKYYLAAYLNLGLLYLDQDSLDKAYEQFDLMVNAEPRDYRGYFYRGKSSELKGNKEKAKLDFESALKLDNQAEEVKEALKTYN